MKKKPMFLSVQAHFKVCLIILITSFATLFFPRRLQRIISMFNIKLLQERSKFETIKIN